MSISGLGEIGRSSVLPEGKKSREMLGYKLTRTLRVVVGVVGTCSTTTLGGSGSVE